MRANQRAIDWTEQGLVPDPVVRHGIRRLLRARLETLACGAEAEARATAEFVAHMKQQAIAPLPHKANEQHYELPAPFFSAVLGRRLKYSCGYWADGVKTLDQAEEQALRVTCERAGIGDGMDILELGCGWGSLTLWMAEHFPASRIVAVSNSSAQGALIRERAELAGFDNIDVITCDMNRFDTPHRFDRVVSVEMLEHMRNYQQLFARIASWLKPGGQFFMHIFCHRTVPYAFVDQNPNDWMSRHFFTGGMMPSDALPLHFQQHMQLLHQWRWNGRHYRDTANAWLFNMDQHRAEIWPLMEQVYGEQRAQQWWMRWRMFFMACAELFAYDDGERWWVSHYLFEKPSAENRESPA